jgi:hypothetical protein
MKVLLCGICFDVRGFPDDGSWVTCRCGNCTAHWQDPHKGTVGVSAKNRTRARVIGMNNGFIHAAFSAIPKTPEDWRKAHELFTKAPGYIFDEKLRGCWACIMQVGETSDTFWEDPPGSVPPKAPPPGPPGPPAPPIPPNHKPVG